MKTAADEHGGGYTGQQGYIRRRSRCGTSTDEMWDYRDGKMGWKDSDGLGKYRQGTTTNLRAYRPSDNLGVGAMTDLNGDSGFVWRLCVSYCNLNKITQRHAIGAEWQRTLYFTIILSSCYLLPPLFLYCWAVI